MGPPERVAKLGSSGRRERPAARRGPSEGVMSSRHVVAIILSALAGSAHAQVTSDPNQIVGTVELTNSNPDVVAILESLLPAQAVTVHGLSQDPAPLSEHESTSPAASALRAEYELTVNASADGTVYVVAPRFAMGPAETTYRFNGTLSPPIYPEPEPDARIDFSECAALLDVRFYTPSGEPKVVSFVSVAVTEGRAVGPPGRAASGFVRDPLSQLYLPAPSGRADEQVRVSYLVAGRRVIEMIPFPDGFTCDAVTDVAVTVPEEFLRFGHITGLFDILGETETSPPQPHHAWIYATYDGLGGTPQFRGGWDDGVDPSSAPFLVSELAASAELGGQPYIVRVSSGVTDWNGRWRAVRTPTMPVVVEDGTTHDLGNTFVITPGYLRGTLTLAGPGVTAGEIPLLGHARPEAGVPQSEVLVSSRRLSLTGDSATANGRARAGLDLRLVGSAGDASTDFELVLPTLSSGSRTPSDWWRLSLFSVHLSSDDSVMPPARQVEQLLTVRPPNIYLRDVWSGDEAEFHDRYCVSEIAVPFRSMTGNLFAPAVRVDGGLSRGETDAWGRSIGYTSQSTASGVPTTIEAAEPAGIVHLVLPAGDYTLEPTMEEVNPTGGSTTTSLPEFPLRVGCRQSIVARPEVQVELSEDLPRCTLETSVTVTGMARASAGLARIERIVDGGAPEAICTDCGTEHEFSFDVTVSGAHDITVRAVSGLGDEATALATTTHSTEPMELSALDRDPAAPPLLIGRTQAGHLKLRWEPSTAGTATVQEGSLASLWDARSYDHVARAPCRLESSEITFEAPEANSYYLVAAACGDAPRPVGRDSNGVGRPVGTACP